MTSKKKTELPRKKRTLTRTEIQAIAKRKGKSVGFQIIRYILLICLGFVIITPILALCKDAFTAPTALGLKNSIWIPQSISNTFIKIASKILNYQGSLLYSLVNTAIITVLQTLCAALAAYSFARLEFKGSKLLFGVVIFSIVVPSDSIMLAQYIGFKNFDIFGIFKLITGNPVNLIGSDISLYLLAGTGMGVKGGLYIYILRQSFRQLPFSIEEAAFIDGAGFLRTFFKIVLPSSTSSLTTVGVLSFLYNYADTYFASLLTSNSSSLSLKLLRAQANMRWAVRDGVGLLPKEYSTMVSMDSPLVQQASAAACALLVIAPLIIMYLFVQKRFVQGVERSGLGGD